MIDITPEAQAVSILWIHTMSEKSRWNLSSKEISDLLNLPPDIYQDILQKATQKNRVSLSNNTLERLSILLGIWKCLQLIAPADRTDLAYAGFNRPIDNEIFEGKSIKELLLDHNETETFYVARRYLEATVS